MQTADLVHEEDISRNPYNIKSWLQYLQAKALSSASPTARYVIYERALKYLPRSYKLWHAYLNDRAHAIEKRCITDKSYMILQGAYERALIHMNKMPRIWLDYCALLVRLKKGTLARRNFDRALQALPVTQHSGIWKLYIDWVRSFGVQDVAMRVYKRFLMFDPSHRESFVDYLEEKEQYGEAARQLTLCIDDEGFISPSGKSRHEMWMHLCDLCANHPQHVANLLDVEKIIRGGISRFSDEVGRLWCRLADYYIRLGQFEQAREIYEEAINTVKTVRDFTIVFDAYVKVEESILSAKMQIMQDDEPGEGQGDSDAEIEMRLARLEFIMEKRPLQLNSVMLRQNPHNVFEWQKRIKLFKDEDKRKLPTFYDALNAIDPQLALGRLSAIWMSLANYYDKSNDLNNARQTWKKAVLVNFKTADELANVWCAWAEMEMHHDNFDEALAIMERAVHEPAPPSARSRKAQQQHGSDDTVPTPASEKVYRNIKVWSLYLDLEESLGTVETCRAAYDRVMELQVITGQMALNYAAFLEEHDFFEDSFRVYERAVSIFNFPHVKKIWLAYLDKFMARYEGTKQERLRDLFEQAIVNVPPEDAAEFYVKYAKAEEAYGLARHAMAVYDRATRTVPAANRLDMHRLYIKKVEQHYGITKTRPAYERAISELDDDMARQICLEYADVERKLGEVDRARTVYQHGSQFADPRREQAYWQKWKEFEEAHGNEDTFRDMLRIQRSVETAFSQVSTFSSSKISLRIFLLIFMKFANPSSHHKVNYLAAEMVAASSAAPKDIDTLALQAEMDALDKAAAAEPAAAGKRKFVSALFAADAPVAAKKKAATEELDIDEGGELMLEERPIPIAVFGSSATA